jgi:hypothetical protein
VEIPSKKSKPSPPPVIAWKHPYAGSLENRSRLGQSGTPS